MVRIHDRPCSPRMEIPDFRARLLRTGVDEHGQSPRSRRRFTQRPPAAVAALSRRANNAALRAMAASFKIVVNYRREDTAGHAGRLYDDLAERFGEDSVFMDIDAIPPGVDFAQAIEQAIGSAQAFLALIGPRWISAADATGARRLEQPDDFVRLEIEAALGSEMLLIPVLFQGTAMPGTEQLPPSLVGLTRRNAVEIRNSSWRYDVDRLIRALEEGGGTKAGVRPRRRIRRWTRNRRAVSARDRCGSRRGGHARRPRGQPRRRGIGRGGHERPHRGRDDRAGGRRGRRPPDLRRVSGAHRRRRRCGRGSGGTRRRGALRPRPPGVRQERPTACALRARAAIGRQRPASTRRRRGSTSTVTAAPAPSSSRFGPATARTGSASPSTGPAPESPSCPRSRTRPAGSPAPADVD